MGYAVRVDGGRLAGAAAELAEVGDDLTRAAEVAARVLHGVAGATGGAALAGAATDAAPRWRAGLTRIATHGTDLALATAGAAEAYLAVEARSTAVWRTGGGARWAP